jgi:hypothetical protein
VRVWDHRLSDELARIREELRLKEREVAALESHAQSRMSLGDPTGKRLMENAAAQRDALTEEMKAAMQFQEDLHVREQRLQRKEKRYENVMQAQREALIHDRNSSIDAMRESGKADMQTWVEGDQYTGVGPVSVSGA